MVAHAGLFIHIAVDLYFHNSKQETKIGHVPYQMKALEKLYSYKPIKCSFDPLFDRQQPKMT